jgi:small subunit ribosomal protein S2
MAEDGTFERLPKKEVAALEREREKLEKNLGGVKEMSQAAQCLFVVDPKKEHIAVTRPTAWASPSSAWWTPTAIRTASTSSSRATTTPSAPSSSSPRRSPDACIEGGARYRASGAADRDEEEAREGRDDRRDRDDRDRRGPRRNDRGGDRRGGDRGGDRRGPLVEMKGAPAAAAGEGGGEAAAGGEEPAAE